MSPLTSTLPKCVPGGAVRSNCAPEDPPRDWDKSCCSWLAGLELPGSTARMSMSTARGPRSQTLRQPRIRHQARVRRHVVLQRLRLQRIKLRPAYLRKVPTQRHIVRFGIAAVFGEGDADGGSDAFVEASRGGTVTALKLVLLQTIALRLFRVWRCDHLRGPLGLAELLGAVHNGLIGGTGLGVFAKDSFADSWDEAGEDREGLDEDFATLSVVRVERGHRFAEDLAQLFVLFLLLFSLLLRLEFASLILLLAGLVLVDLFPHFLDQAVFRVVLLFARPKVRQSRLGALPMLRDLRVFSSPSSQWANASLPPLMASVLSTSRACDLYLNARCLPSGCNIAQDSCTTPTFPRAHGSAFRVI